MIDFRKKFMQLNKGHFEKSTANYVFGEKLKAIVLSSAMRQQGLALPFYHTIESPFMDH